MRVIKTIGKQIKYQQAGKLYFIHDGKYIRCGLMDIGRTDVALYGKL